MCCVRQMLRDFGFWFYIFFLDLLVFRRVHVVWMWFYFGSCAWPCWVDVTVVVVQTMFLSAVVNKICKFNVPLCAFPFTHSFGVLFFPLLIIIFLCQIGKRHVVDGDKLLRTCNGCYVGWHFHFCSSRKDVGGRQNKKGSPHTHTHTQDTLPCQTNFYLLI